MSDTESAFSAQTYVTEVFLVMAYAFLVYALVPNKILDVMPAAIIMFLSMLIFAVVVRAAAPANSSIAIQLEHLIYEPPDSDMLQVVFLPPILFADCLEVDVPWFNRVKWQALWLIVPVLMGSSVVIALFPYLLTLTGEFTLAESVALGGLVADTDPVAVLMVLETMGGPESLQALLGSESLFNDAVSIILVELMLDIIGGRFHTAGSIIAYFCREVLLAFIIGVAFSIGVILATRLVRGETVAVVMLSLTAAYLAFTVSIYYVGCSGILAVVTLALVLNKYAGVVLEYHMQEILKFWRALEFIAENLFFAFAGALVGSYFYDASEAIEWLNLFCFALWVLMVRAVMFFVSMPVLDRIGPKVGWKQSLIAVVGSMRGAVTIILAIAFHQRVTEEGRPQTAQLGLFLSGGVVFGFMLNITYLTPLCKALGLTSDPHSNPIFLRVRENIRRDTFMLLTYIHGGDEEKAKQLLTKSQRALTSIQIKNFLPKAALVHSDNNSQEGHQLAKPQSDDDANVDAELKSTNIQEMRCIFERCMHESFLSHLNGGLITPHAYIILKETLQWRKESGAQLLTWENVVEKGIPFWCRIIRKLCGKRLDHYFDSHFFVPAAWSFLVAHERARQSLHKLLLLEGHSLNNLESEAPLEFTSLLAESERCSLKAAQFLHHCAEKLPERFKVLKSLQARYVALEFNLGLVHELKSNGICTPMVVKALQEEAKAIHMQLKTGKRFFTIQDPIDIGPGGTGLLHNVNFAPFLDEARARQARLEQEWTMSHTFRTSVLLQEENEYELQQENAEHPITSQTSSSSARLLETLHILSEDGELSTNERLKALQDTTEARVISETDTS